MLLFFVLFFVRLRFLFEFLLPELEVRLLLALMLVSVGGPKVTVVVIGSFSVGSACVTVDSVVCVSFCKPEYVFVHVEKLVRHYGAKISRESHGQ